MFSYENRSPLQGAFFLFVPTIEDKQKEKQKRQKAVPLSVLLVFNSNSNLQNILHMFDRSKHIPRDSQ